MKSSPSSIFIISLVVFVGICNAADFSGTVAKAFGECVATYVNTLWGKDGYTPSNTAPHAFDLYKGLCPSITAHTKLNTATNSVLMSTLVYFPWSDSATLVEDATGTMCTCAQNCGGNFSGNNLPGRNQFLANFEKAGHTKDKFNNKCP